MSNKVALITGSTGQDGAYLAELLLKKGYAAAQDTRGKVGAEFRLRCLRVRTCSPTVLPHVTHIKVSL